MNIKFRRVKDAHRFCCFLYRWNNGGFNKITYEQRSLLNVAFWFTSYTDERDKDKMLDDIDCYLTSKDYRFI